MDEKLERCLTSWGAYFVPETAVVMPDMPLQVDEFQAFRVGFRYSWEDPVRGLIEGVGYLGILFDADQNPVGKISLGRREGKDWRLRIQYLEADVRRERDVLVPRKGGSAVLQIALRWFNEKLWKLLLSHRYVAPERHVRPRLAGPVGRLP